MLMQFTLGLTYLGLSYGHMEMVTPAPRQSKYHPGYKGGNIDYSMTSPLSGSYTFPCRGFAKGAVFKEYSAGEDVKTVIGGSATHGGGHCQFALSYDNVNFVTIHTVFGNCLTASKEYSVTIPSDAPSGPAVFAWVWNNKLGNRELYMNCADIVIKGGTSKKLVGKELLIANFKVNGKTSHSFPEGFSDDFGKDLFENQPEISISPDGSAQLPQQIPKPRPDDTSYPEAPQENHRPTENPEDSQEDYIDSPAENPEQPQQEYPTPPSENSDESQDCTDLDSENTEEPQQEDKYSPVEPPSENPEDSEQDCIDPTSDQSKGYPESPSNKPKDSNQGLPNSPNMPQQGDPNSPTPVEDPGYGFPQQTQPEQMNPGQSMDESTPSTSVKKDSPYKPAPVNKPSANTPNHSYNPGNTYNPQRTPPMTPHKPKRAKRHPKPPARGNHSIFSPIKGQCETLQMTCKGTHSVVTCFKNVSTTSPCPPSTACMETSDMASCVRQH